MSRYFFNVRGELDSFDDVGFELDGMRAVHAHMMAEASRLAVASDQIYKADGELEIEALDIDGKIVATLTLTATRTASSND